MKVGVVQDKLFLPGLLKLRRLVESGFFGRIIAARGEFGYWVYPGPDPKPQRPSWNYRSEDGGGIISDMFPHWRYVLDNVFGPVRSVCAIGATHIPQRVDEDGEPYDATAEDAAYAMFEFDGGADRADELVLVRARATATSCSSCRSTARTAAPSPACASARSSPR